MNELELTSLLDRLVARPEESEWLEFKHNFHSREEIGERISALSNNAALINLPYGYLVFGVEDGSHNIVGTSFKCQKNYPMVSIIIREAVKRGLIKVGTPEGTNRRDVAYIPSWG
ncbi:MAG: ATP-binding protein [Muribaculaceae bacterium]|nr:ATP-binding protein [Muribaculaceae bacterium]